MTGLRARCVAMGECWPGGSSIAFWFLAHTALSMTAHETELDHRDGAAFCPHPDCEWWVPAGMEYLYLTHRDEHE